MIPPADSHEPDSHPPEPLDGPKQPADEGVDPKVSLASDAVDAPSTGTGELLTRLAHHSLKESRYKLQGEIARGGMGAILKVWDEDLRRTLAMKVVLGKAGPSPEGATPPVDSRMLGRFLEEAQVTGQLDHPGIAPVHELGLDSDGRVFFTMKLVKGRDLKHIFDLVFGGKEDWNETRALSVMLKVCEAMAYAHTKGVIHRDLKPANVMVGNFGEVYVMDWGLARVLGRKDSHDIRLRPEFTTSLASVKTERREDREDAPDSPLVTMDGDVMGTPAYMPPEQAEGEIEKLSPRSDVYAIGAMLYHLLARQMPYVKPRAKISNRTVLAMVLQNAPAPLASLRKDVSAELGAICEKAMAREPEQRYADTLALAEDLRAYLEHRVVGAYETGAWAETKKWVERNKPLAASLAAGVLALMIGLVASLSLKHKSDANAELASKNAQEAQRQGTNATRNLENLLSLSGIVDLPQELGELVRRADELWPARPERVPEYESWLRDAQALLQGIHANGSTGTNSTPSLEEQSRKLAEVDARALPQSQQERELERRTHPRFSELEKKKVELQWLSCMLGKAAWPSESTVNAELASEVFPSDAAGLRNVARSLLESGKPVPIDAVRALLLARRAVEAASDVERASCRELLAWALFFNGRLEEALSEGGVAVSAALADKQEEFQGSLDKLRAQVDSWTFSTGHKAHEDDWKRLSTGVPELEREVSLRRSWSFAHREDQILHALLSKLVANLEAFADPRAGLTSNGVSPEHGWGMQQRLRFASIVEERTVSGPEARTRWSEAIRSIQDPAHCPKYHGLAVVPQLGLLPIGRDEASGLWEFSDLATGEVAERESGGRIALKESTGVVFVLIPGGTFLMGAQSAGSNAPHFDPWANPDESPIHEVALQPFFLSKFEMTQAQWRRLTATDPSLYTPDNYDESWDKSGRMNVLLHPVERVSWDDCMKTLSRLGMTLPTEAQWEYACRAGTETVYWSGDEMESLEGVANISDAYGQSHGNEHYSEWEYWLDDGQTVHAEVGTYRANPFGLFDMYGNVWEWCLDRYGSYTLPVHEDDGERQVDEPVLWVARTRVFRGGSFAGTANYARSAGRKVDLPGREGSGIGLRPALVLKAR